MFASSRRACFCAVVTVLLAPLAGVQAEWDYLGLRGRQVRALEVENGWLYAGTDDGLYRRALSSTDTLWTTVGLAGRRIRSLLFSGASTLLAGMDPTGTGDDTTLIFKSVDGGHGWQAILTPALTNGVEVRSLETRTDHPVTIYAALAGDLLESVDGGTSWSSIHASHIYNSVRVAPTAGNIVWAGGENVLFWPVCCRSQDGGATWDDGVLDWFSYGDNAVDCIEIDPYAPAVVYLGMEGFVIRSTDGGENWDIVMENLFYNFAVVIDPRDSSRIYCSGASAVAPFNEALFLFISDDAGATWETSEHAPGPGLYGVFDMEVWPEDNATDVYLAGSGVYRFRPPPPTGLDSSPPPREVQLVQNKPNPFNPRTVIAYELPAAMPVGLGVYDISGRLVCVLRFGDVEPAGKHTAIWDGKDGQGHPAAAGIYFYRLAAGDGAMTKRMVLVR